MNNKFYNTKAELDVMCMQHPDQRESQQDITACRSRRGTAGEDVDVLRGYIARISDLEKEVGLLPTWHLEVLCFKQGTKVIGLMHACSHSCDFAVCCNEWVS